MTHSLSESLAGASPIGWAVEWLEVAGFPGTPSNVRAVLAWMSAESAGGGGMFNPLNTTQGGYAGETNANSVGVKNYRTRADGLAANAKVIHNGLYGPVVAAFQRGDSARAVVDAIVRSPWGTRHIVLGDVPNVPTPAPPANTGGDLLTTVAFAKPATNGRRPTARPVPQFDAVLLENGARVRGDVASGVNHTWIPAELPHIGCRLVDIAALGGDHPFVALYRAPTGDLLTYEAQLR